MNFKKINYGRVLEPLVLGAIANTIINYIFDPENPDFVLSEFLIAFVFAAIVTEVNRKINSTLEKKYSWTHNFGKRFSSHLIYLTIALILILNVVGNLYLWIVGDGFHTFRELLIINLCVFILALLLTFLKWSTHFYYNWRKTEHHLKASTQQFNTLKSEVSKAEQQIELLKGNDLYKVHANDVQYARIEHEIVWVYFEEGNKGVYQDTLYNLNNMLPDFLFFQTTRNTIVRKDMIQSIASSTYGKIDVKLKGKSFEDYIITVSRPKAAQFRKWYHSN